MQNYIGSSESFSRWLVDKLIRELPEFRQYLEARVLARLNLQGPFQSTSDAPKLGEKRREEELFFDQPTCAVQSKEKQSDLIQIVNSVIVAIQAFVGMFLLFCEQGTNEFALESKTPKLAGVLYSVNTRILDLYSLKKTGGIEQPQKSQLAAVGRSVIRTLDLVCRSVESAPLRSVIFSCSAVYKVCRNYYDLLQQYGSFPGEKKASLLKEILAIERYVISPLVRLEAKRAEKEKKINKMLDAAVLAPDKQSKGRINFVSQQYSPNRGFLLPSSLRASKTLIKKPAHKESATLRTRRNSFNDLIQIFQNGDLVPQIRKTSYDVARSRSRNLTDDSKLDDLISEFDQDLDVALSDIVNDLCV